MNSESRKPPNDQSIGLIAALSAFLIWGGLPLYFHLLGESVSPWEVLIHRVLWSAVILLGVALVTQRLDRVRATFADRRLLLWLALSAALVATNWGTFIWAVVNNHVLETSLGYYINPLLNVALGFIFLGERLRRLQQAAVAVATTGVLIMIVAFGTVPWVALVLAGSMGFYALVRKQLAVDSITGLLVETLLLSPIMLVAFAVLHARSGMAFFHDNLHIDLLLIGAGVLTVVPFASFAAAAQRLRLGTLGLIQYLTPTLHLLSGVFILKETFTATDGVTFVFIWIGLVLYTIDALRQRRTTRVIRREQAADAVDGAHTGDKEDTV
ncbi:MAG: EamA family transporter RarD [Salinisphaera sp.]|jgi:chloramphenicol-sensitive protein RarD|nr:EamA family transporter RarD [Salinisphaera sp.]